MIGDCHGEVMIENQTDTAPVRINVDQDDWRLIAGDKSGQSRSGRLKADGSDVVGFKLSYNVVDDVFGDGYDLNLKIVGLFFDKVPIKIDFFFSLAMKIICKKLKA